MTETRMINSFELFVWILFTEEPLTENSKRKSKDRKRSSSEVLNQNAGILFAEFEVIESFRWAGTKRPKDWKGARKKVFAWSTIQWSSLTVHLVFINSFDLSWIVSSRPQCGNFSYLFVGLSSCRSIRNTESVMLVSNRWAWFPFLPSYLVHFLSEFHLSVPSLLTQSFGGL